MSRIRQILQAFAQGAGSKAAVGSTIGLGLVGGLLYAGSISLYNGKKKMNFFFLLFSLNFILFYFILFWKITILNISK